LDKGITPQDGGMGSQSSVPPVKMKRRLSMTGKIILALLLAALLFAVCRVGNCGGSGDEENVSPDKSASPDTAISKDKRRASKKTSPVNEVAAPIPPPPAPAAPPPPEYLMAFGDVRRLVSEHEIAVNTSRQEIVIAPQSDKKRRGNKESEDETLSLYMSTDTSIQKYVMSILSRYAPRYGAVVALDPTTGRVLALASFAGEGEPLDGRDLYLKSVFPAASVFKTVVVSAAVERGGMNRDSQIPHVGRTTTLYRSQLAENLNTPHDISLQDAFAHSNNPAFGRIGLYVINRNIITDYGRRFGFHAQVPFEFDVEESVMLNPDSTFRIAEFASGFNRETSITPLLGALIAGAICESGVIYEPTLIDSIRSSKRDTLLYERKTKEWKRPIKAVTAAEVRWLMTKVTHYGTARTTFRPLRESEKYGYYEFGGKTGSVNKQGLGKVDWFVGFARNPNNKNHRIAIGVVTTHGEYWTVKSNYIAAEVFKKYISNKEPPARVQKSPE